MKLWHIIPVLLVGYILGAAYPQLFNKAKSSFSGSMAQ
jgi:hypothetical protein